MSYNEEAVKKVVFDWFDKNEEKVIGVSKEIWDSPEVMWTEFKSSKLLADWLEENGFTVERGVADMPTAFVCNCDETAFRVINSLKSKGLRVPEDISVVGYDNYTVSSICIPPITTIEVNIEKMAETAVEIIARKLENPDYLAGRRIITGKLIEKKSVLDIRGLYGDFSAQETI